MMQQPAYPPAGPPRPQTWFQRNWRWFVPVGCFGVLLAFLGFIAVLLGVVAFSMRSSDAYRDAMASATTHPAVVAELGAPVEPGWFVSGSVRVTGPSGEADLAIPISGPRKEGTLFAVGTKTAGRWTFSTLEVEVDGSPTRISLLPSLGTP
jgi:hypothetical protein